MKNCIMPVSTLLIGIFYISASVALLPAPDLFGEMYQPVLPVVKEQTQIVYYRPSGPHITAQPANVYVDGRYHTSLLAGGFTSFCLKPGVHSLGAFVDDPKYLGKTEGRFEASLSGGRTYFMRVDEDQQLAEPPLAVTRDAHEKEVKKTRRQIHARSRASHIEYCIHDRAAAQQASAYVLSNRLLFKHELGRLVLSDAGMTAINDVVVTIRQQHPLLHAVVIRLTAPEFDRDQLREQARAVRNALTLAAIPASLISHEFSFCDKDCLIEEQSVQILAN
ncbi:hypothetical protein [Pantoea agglomerans]